MSDFSWGTIRDLVYKRARSCCEYCQTSEENIGQAMHVEHIRPSGGDDLDNFCLACSNCNLSKAIALSAVDPVTETEISLFNPRQQVWSEHFAWIDDGVRVMGLTPVGRATVERLKMNRDRIVRVRRRWVEAGFHPPEQ